MKNKGSDYLRLLGAFGLYLLIGLVAIPTLPAHWIGWGGLWLIEALAAKANQLRGAGS